MSFQDIFKKSFLEGFSSTQITSGTVWVALGIASVLALYIYLIYRFVTVKTFYSKGFNITLAGVTVITASLILTMQSSVVLSLGMVGALSIVRFRTAIKEPMDLMFLFWAISVGIICGAGMAQIAVILSIVLTVGIFLLNKIPLTKPPMILVVNAADTDAGEQIEQAVARYDQRARVKSRNMTATTLDMVIELRIAQGGELVRSVMEIPGVTAASLVTHDGESVY